MNLYISAASSEHKRVSKLENVLVCTSKVSIYDRWWVDAPTFTGKDHTHPPEERRRITRGHFAAIDDCHVFWFLAPSKGHHTRMGWAELGFAQAQSRALTIVVSGEFATASVCTSLSDRLFLSDDEALAYVVELARKS